MRFLQDTSRFLQDSPVQNSKKARQALNTVAAIKFSVPPCSPDFNPIENIFDYIKSELRTQTFEKSIHYGSFKQFCISVKHTIESIRT